MTRHVPIRRVRATVVTLAAIGLLAACGGGPGEPSESATGGETTESPSGGDDAAPIVELEGYPDLSGVTLELAAQWTGPEQDTVEAVLEPFEAATGARVDYLTTGSDVLPNIRAAVREGVPPNVAIVDRPSTMEQLALDESIVPLGDEVAAEVDANYAQTWADLGSVDGDLYGVWFEASSKSIVWYNTAVYADAGVAEPQTWEEFVAGLRAVSDSGVPGLSLGADIGWPLTDWFENVYVRTAGPEMYDRLSDREIPWTDPTVVEALEHLAEVWGDPDLLLPDALDTSFPESVTAVFTDPPEAGTVVGPDYTAGNIAYQTTAVVGEDASSFPWPSMDDSAPTVIGAGTLAVAFDGSEGTQALMRYLASPEAADVWIERGGITSPNRNADLDLYGDLSSRRVAEQLVDAEVFRLDLFDNAPSSFGGPVPDGMWGILLDFLADPSDPAATAEELEDAAVEAYPAPAAEADED
ncbi:Alpha-glucosides-binding periplasmic protein AglE precursor [Actinomycetales bacterium JB111]|nr:Alpha-glucosides-binding periplasmic protein AglE precursor [Actinomycetales bacterium JB111]